MKHNFDESVLHNGTPASGCMFLLHNGPPAAGAHTLGVIDVLVDGVSELPRGHTFISINGSCSPPRHISVTA